MMIKGSCGSCGDPYEDHEWLEDHSYGMCNTCNQCEGYFEDDDFLPDEYDEDPEDAWRRIGPDEGWTG